MAVRKKKTSKKKISKKKTSAAKKALKKSAKKAVKKGVKKKAAKKKATKKSNKKPVKKAASSSKPSKKKVAPKSRAPQKGAASTATAAQPQRKRIRQSKGALKTGTQVRVRAGRNAGESGRIARQDDYLGTYFMYLDRCKKDPVYQNIEWGPYFASQLDVI